ncbi:MAG: hypothetical protein ABIO60_03610, partial [Aquaticitalea sp.]
MKHFFKIFVLLIFLGCKTKIVETPQENIKEIPKMSVSKSSDSHFITSKELKETVSYLASDELQGRD